MIRIIVSKGEAELNGICADWQRNDCHDGAGVVL